MQNKRFIVTGTQRTGSSFLATSIEQHPDIACGWEWTLDLPSIKRVKAMDKGLSGDFSLLSDKCRTHMESFQFPTKAIGFRWLFSSSPKWIISPGFSLSRYYERLPGYFTYLKKNPDVKVIHVTREDDVGWLVSLFAAKKTGSFIGAKHSDELMVTVPTDKARKRLQAKHDLDATLRASAETNPYLHIDYDQIQSNSADVFKRVFDFIGVDTEFAPQARTQKQQNKAYSDVVENYDELMACIKGI